MNPTPPPSIDVGAQMTQMSEQLIAQLGPAFLGIARAFLPILVLIVGIRFVWAMAERSVGREAEDVHDWYAEASDGFTARAIRIDVGDDDEDNEWSAEY